MTVILVDFIIPPRCGTSCLSKSYTSPAPQPTAEFNVSGIAYGSLDRFPRAFRLFSAEGTYPLRFGRAVERKSGCIVGMEAAIKAKLPSSL